MISNIFNLNTDPYQNPEWYYPAQRYFDAQQLIPNIEQSIDFQVNRGEMSEMIWQTQQHMDFLTKTNPSADYFSVPYEKERIDVFNAVNQERQNNGREKLLYSMQLEKAAQIHAEAMMRAGDIFHRDPATGQTAAERVKYFQYDQRYFGENVAKGQANATEAMVSWINSPPHYENIMQADAREIGVGISANPQGELFWVQVFGRQCEERDYLIGCTTRSDFQERNPGEYVSPFSWY